MPPITPYMPPSIGPPLAFCSLMLLLMIVATVADIMLASAQCGKPPAQPNAGMEMAVGRPVGAAQPVVAQAAVAQAVAVPVQQFEAGKGVV